MSLVVSVANAIVDVLNTAQVETFAQGFAAERQYKPEYDLAQLKTLRVTVVPKKIEIASLGRNVNQHDVSVDVAIQKKVASASVEELDPLMAFAEQIADYLRLKRLALGEDGAGGSAIWAKTENVPIYSPEHLEQKQVFTSVLTVTFRVVR